MSIAMSEMEDNDSFSFSLKIGNRFISVPYDSVLKAHFKSINSQDKIALLFPNEQLTSEDLLELQNYFIAFLYGVSLVMQRFAIPCPGIVIIDNPEVQKIIGKICYIPKSKQIALSRDFFLDNLRGKTEFVMSGDSQEKLFLSGEVNRGKFIVISKTPTMHIISYGIQETIHHLQNLRGAEFSNMQTIEWELRPEEAEAFRLTKELIEQNEVLVGAYAFVASVSADESTN